MLNFVSSARISPQFHSIFPMKTSLLVLWQSRNLINFVFGVRVGFCCKIVGTFVLLSNWTCRNVWWVIWSQFGVRRLCGSTVWVKTQLTPLAKKTSKMSDAPEWSQAFQMRLWTSLYIFYMCTFFCWRVNGYRGVFESSVGEAIICKIFQRLHITCCYRLHTSL